MMIMTFLEGLFSFFSPCIIPILPLYFGYLSGNAKRVKEDGTIYYQQKTIFYYTLFFVLGICTSFFILGFSFTIVGQLFEKAQYAIAVISGLLIIIFGLIQLDVIHFPKLNQEKRLNVSINPKKLGIFTTFLLGFSFSFAWTPCVGPTLSSVLLLSLGSSPLIGALYLFTYALGFIVPFLILGIFTSTVLKWLKKSQTYMKSIIRFGGFVLIVMGLILTIQNGIFLYQQSTLTKQDKIYDYVFKDQFGMDQNLIQYQGKIIITAFLDRLCTSCQAEMKDLEVLYQEYQQNKGDIIILGVMKMGLGDTEENTKKYLEKNGYHFPIIYDFNDHMKITYDITDYPTMILFGADGYKKKQLVGLVGIETTKQVLEETRCLGELC